MGKKSTAGIVVTVIAVILGVILGLAKSEDKRYSYRVGKG